MMRLAAIVVSSGRAHNEMIMGEDVSDETVATAIDKAGKALV